MSLYIASLNSGSNGNCYYIGTRHEAVLIDAGLSCRETEKRMKRLDLSMSMVKALFVSHEHGDHITGIPGISKKFHLPVYITNATFRNAKIPVDPVLVNTFQAEVPVSIGGLVITAFRKSHDASDPHSFMVSGNNVNIGIFTDIGHACKHVIRYFKKCNAAFLEANYCETMLENGGYPYHLKRRISSDEGHLSNRQALELFNKYRSKELRLLLLSHLSKNNNSPELVEKLFNPHAYGAQIIVASRYNETKVYHVANSNSAPAPRIVTRIKKPQFQLSLFD